jgi:hypothetical protein
VSGPDAAMASDTSAARLRGTAIWNVGAAVTVGAGVCVTVALTVGGRAVIVGCGVLDAVAAGRFVRTVAAMVGA